MLRLQSKEGATGNGSRDISEVAYPGPWAPDGAPIGGLPNWTRVI